MVDFRKMFPVLVVALLLGVMSASAQTSPALTCSSAAGVTPTLRAEGLTELAGDLVLNCTGGDPTAPFLSTVQIYANTNITSKLLSTSGDRGFTEALLILNEPKVVATSGQNGTTYASGIKLAPYNTVLDPKNPLGYNTFRGAHTTDSSITWAGVPITPPGTNPNSVLVIRITNLRVDASRLLPAGSTASGLLPQQLIVYISINGSTTVPINPSQQVLGYVQSGLSFAVTNCSNSADAGTTNFRQCSSSANTILNPGRSNTVSFGIRFSENFYTAFKDRSTPTTPNLSGESIPGYAFNQNSELGFVSPSKLAGETGTVNTATRLITRWTNVPKGVDIYVGAGNTYFYGVNTADVSGSYNSYGGSPSLAATAITGFDAYGAGGTAATPLTAGSSTVTGTMSALTARFPTCSGSDPAVTLSPNVSTVKIGTTTVPQVTFPGLIEVAIDASGNGTAVWEVTSSSSLAVETAWFPVVISYSTNLSAGTPPLGTANVYGVMGPAYPTTVAANVSTFDYTAGGLNYPRFADVPPASRPKPFAIVICQTSLLFPFVTNQGGFDTGIALINTSKDPFSSANANEGTCEINYYGSLADGSALTKTRETSATVGAGTYLTFTLSGASTDSKVTGNPGFQGYMIVRCNFFYAHGYAFISDAGAQKLAHGYIALIMDGDTANNASNRGSAAERLNN